MGFEKLAAIVHGFHMSFLLKPFVCYEDCSIKFTTSCNGIHKHNSPGDNTEQTNKGIAHWNTPKRRSSVPHDCLHNNTTNRTNKYTMGDLLTY